VAEGRLNRRAPGSRAAAGAAVALVVAGVIAEAVAPAASGLLTAADLAAGSACAVAGARLWRRSRRLAALAGGTGLLWFAGTAIGAWAAAPGGLVTMVLLSYRVPLIALGWHLPRRGSKVVAGAAVLGLLAVLLPAHAAGVTTAALLGGGAVRALLVTRSQRIDERAGSAQRGLLALALTGLWLLAALAPLPARGADAAQLGVALLVGWLALGVAWPPDGSRGRGTAATVVVELGPSDAVTPLVARLRRLLADDALAVRFLTAAGVWVDDVGRPVDPPDLGGSRSTPVPTPGGGAVLLLHGSSAPVPAQLSQAAAAASGLAWERIELDAQARRQAEQVAVSRRRLLETADDERRALEAELRHGPLATLARVSEQLEAVPGAEAAELRDLLRDAVDDLVRLGRGLYPGAVSSAELEPALRRLVDTTPVPAQLDVIGDLSALELQQRAQLWFVCSECLTNVVRYARATRVTVRCEVAGALVVTVTDDGVGGASVATGRGLRGLADRLDTTGGRLDVDSPPGGPTTIAATIPLH
jgi:signal transduction histidine kinase